MRKLKICLYVCCCFVIISLAVISCKKQTVQPQEEFSSSPQLPEVSYDYFTKHGVNSDVATLGRVLFYDRSLSTNNSISCGSCHKQEFAFADNARFSRGFDGRLLQRNSPSIQAMKGFSTGIITTFTSGITSTVSMSGIPSTDNQKQVLMFWDGRQRNMADMVLNPVLNHREMNMPDFESLVSKLQQLPYYPELFKKAYGDESISKERIGFAMEAFISCLNTTSLNSEPVFFNSTPFEQGDITGNGGAPTQSTLSATEELGKELFHSKYNCAKCHDPFNGGAYGGGGLIFNQAQMFNIGLDEVYTDQGWGRITGLPGDMGLFKVPTLKNISVTAPYMHDGRFANLGEVIDHYSHGIKNNNNLSGLFRGTDGAPVKLNILPQEKEAIIAFLNTLKDDDFLHHPMYSDPFKKSN